MAREGPAASAARRRAATGGPQPTPVHQLKVTLHGVRPPIWRRLEVGSGSTLGKLHAVLQIAFAWEDCHLHEFQVGARRFGRPDMKDALAESGDTENENGTTLGQVMRRRGAKFLYVYDFGDSWEHEIGRGRGACGPARPVPALPRWTTRGAARGLRRRLGLR